MFSWRNARSIQGRLVVYLNDLLIRLIVSLRENAPAVLPRCITRTGLVGNASRPHLHDLHVTHRLLIVASNH